jgi:hypothetical protein
MANLYSSSHSTQRTIYCRYGHQTALGSAARKTGIEGVGPSRIVATLPVTHEQYCELG